MLSPAMEVRLGLLGSEAGRHLQRGHGSPGSWRRALASTHKPCPLHAQCTGRAPGTLGGSAKEMAHAHQGWGAGPQALQEVDTLLAGAGQCLSCHRAQAS